MPKKLIFSDIDGTLVHISDDALLKWGTVSEDGRSFETPEGARIAIRPLPPSSTGTQAFISEKTLRLVAEIRRAGHLFVLISGARSSTFMERLPYLPAADAYVMENGGRIFLPTRDSSAATAAPIVEDLEWRSRHEAAPLVLESMPPSDRPGILWDLYKKLEKEGWACDANKYSTDFRVSLKKSKGKTAADLEKVMSNLPPQLASSFNLGSADFYPSSSGKDKAAEYLMKKFGFAREDSVSMGDDDNDLALARIVGHTYIPGITADSVRKAVAADPLAFTVARHGAFLGTHEVLERIQELPIRSTRSLLVCSVVVLSLVVLAARRRQRRA